MAGQVRVLRRRIRTTRSTKKITKAMELVATSRIAKAQERVAASLPYAEAITGVLTALASQREHRPPAAAAAPEQVRRAGVLLITSDRGLCGGYNANAIRTAEQLISRLRDDGKQVAAVRRSGARASAYYRFRNRPIEASWTGFSEQPTFADAREVGETLIEAFVAGADDDGDGHAGADGVLGVDELHIVYTAVPVADDPDAGRRSCSRRCRSRSGERTERRPAAGVRVRAGAGGAARRAAAEVHQHADLRGVAGLGGERVGGPAAGDEERHRQRGRHDQDAARAR